MTDPNRIGTVLQGRYRIADVLGRGGFGAVYLCEDLRLPGKRWALKELVCPDPQMIQEVRRNFEREAHMLSALRHRSLPVIVDYFSEGDRDYLVMEQVEGRTLARTVEEEGPASEAEALRWALEMARVLDYLHHQDPPVIFRDLKPENVMVSDDRHVKIIDFGLARHFDPGKRRDTEAMGSVGYAPPEVWEDASQTDARSDVYSLGATLYFVLTGRPPSPVYGTHKLGPYRKDLSPDVEALVLRCMETDPGRRFSAVGELIRELMVLLSRLDPGSSGEFPVPTPRSGAPEARTKQGAPPKAALPASQPVAQATGRPTRLLARRPPRAEAVPRWLTGLLAVASVMFLLGAVLGWRYQPAQSPPVTGGVSPADIRNPDKEEARQLLEQGDLRQAATLLDQAVTRFPADAEAHILRENAFARLSGARPMRVPALMSITGPDANEGYRLLHGIAAAQGEVNRSGGIDGHPVVVEVYDDGSDTERALAISQKILEDPEYVVALGPFNSQRTLAVARLFNAARMPILAPVASDPRVWEAGKYVFTASDSNFPRIRAVAHRLIASGYRKGAILVDRDSVLSATMAAFFHDQFEAMGGEIVAEPLFSSGDFSSQIGELRSARPDFVFFSDYRGAALAQFMVELRAAGLGIPVAGQVAPFARDLVDLAGPDAEGVLVSGYFHYDTPRPEVQDYSQRFRQLYGDLPPTHLDASAYDAARLVFEALRSGAHTRQQVRDYLASVGAVEGGRPPFAGVTGTFSLARRLDTRDVYLIEVRNGEYRLLEKESASGPPG